MTNEQYDRATEIFSEIKHLREINHMMHYNPHITDSTANTSGLYFSWFDKDEELRNYIKEWCKSKIKKLEQELKEL